MEFGLLMNNWIGKNSMKNGQGQVPLDIYLLLVYTQTEYEPIAEKQEVYYFNPTTIGIQKDVMCILVLSSPHIFE